MNYSFPIHWLESGKLHFVKKNVCKNIFWTISSAHLAEPLLLASVSQNGIGSLSSVLRLLITVSCKDYTLLCPSGSIRPRGRTMYCFSNLFWVIFGTIHSRNESLIQDGGRAQSSGQYLSRTLDRKLLAVISWGIKTYFCKDFQQQTCYFTTQSLHRSQIQSFFPSFLGF